MTSSLNSEPKVLRLLCLKHDGLWWEVMVGPGWLPERLRSFLDEHLSTGPLLLDFEYLKDRLAKNGLTISIQEGEAGMRTILAEGEAAGVAAIWLASAMASSSLPPARG